MLFVHLTASRFFGGPERQMLELAKELRPTIRSTFVSFSEVGLSRNFVEQARDAGFDAIVLRHDTPRLLAALRELLGVLRRVGADVLCCHGYKSNLLGLLAARRLGIPVISVSHGWTGECLKVRLYEALDRRVLHRMDKVVCVSEAQAQKVRRAGAPDTKVQVIHDAVRAERFANVDSEDRRRLEGMFPQRPNLIVGAAGRLSPEKGFHVLIDAAAMVLSGQRSAISGQWSEVRGQRSEVSSQRSEFSSQRSADVAPLPLPPSAFPIGFVLFGDGPLREPLAQQIAARGLEGRFILAGFRSDLDRFLPHLDLFVQSSFTEGLPNVVLESYAAGVPVVATAVGGTPEIIEDGFNGLLAAPGDPVALARRIAEGLADDAKRRNMAALGNQRVRDLFSFGAQAASYSQLLHDLVGPLDHNRPPSITTFAATKRTARPVRVCFVIDRLGVAGTETQLLMLIRTLDRAAVQPFLCLLDGNDDVSHGLEPADCPTIRLGVRKLHRPSTLWAAWRFGRFLRQHRIDIVQTHFQDSTYFAVPVAKLSGVKHVIRTRRDLGYWMRPVDRWLGRLYNHLTTATVVNCKACRRAVIEQEAVDPDRVVVIPNGIDLDRFAWIPPYAPSVNGQPRRVGMVANLRPVKAPDVFVRAAAIVAQSHPNVIFQIAGLGDVESVRRLARQCGIEDRLELLGQVDDIPSFLAGLDVAVLTSHSEGLSNSLLEYMAAGRPIVATAVGGNLGLLDNGVDGLLVPPDSPGAAADGIARVLADPAFGERMGSAARRRVARESAACPKLNGHERFFNRLVYRGRFG